MERIPGRFAVIVLYVLSVLPGYIAWLGLTYLFGIWIDDVLPEGKGKDIIMDSIIITWIPAMVLYTYAARSFLMQKWLWNGCRNSRDELWYGFFD